MKAVYIKSHGGPEVLVVGDRPEPLVQSTNVKIRVKACALNRLDIYTRKGNRGLKRSFSKPLILGGDASGDVVEIGDKVSRLNVGDRVLINPLINCRECDYCHEGQDDLCPRYKFLGTQIDGSYAGYICVPAENVYPIADNISYEAAAAVPTTFLPVWNILIRKGKLKPWETVLILSASSGVGSAAILVARKVVGAKVIVSTSSPDKVEKALSLGANEAINYNEEDISDKVHDITKGLGVDMVVDHVGTQFFSKALGSLKRGGRYGVCGVTSGYKADLHMGNLFQKNLHIFGAFMGSKKDMSQIVAMVNQGTINPLIDRVFRLEQAAEAHLLMESQNFFGKIVLRV